MEFQQTFIGFVDILGFKDMVKALEAGSGKPLSDLMELLQLLGSEKDTGKFAKDGPGTCPY